jgi:hypothetical protein
MNVELIQNKIKASQSSNIPVWLGKVFILSDFNRRNSTWSNCNLKIQTNMFDKGKCLKRQNNMNHHGNFSCSRSFVYYIVLINLSRCGKSHFYIFRENNSRTEGNSQSKISEKFISPTKRKSDCVLWSHLLFDLKLIFKVSTK